MSYYRDPTAGAAIGSVDKEFSRMRKLAVSIRDRFDRGEMTPREFEAACRQFDGYYFQTLVSVMKEAPRPSDDESA